MILSRLLRQADIDPIASFGDAEVTGAQLDSRKCGPGTLFFCMPGGSLDSHRFLEDALRNEAAAAVVYSQDGFDAAHAMGFPAVLLADVREATWKICDVLFKHPTRTMKVVGVTGTNGKTTTAWLIRDMLNSLGARAGYLGTLGLQIPGEERELSNTTPFAVELSNLLVEARGRRVEALAMEVSSHALAEGRADGVEFDVGVFTNLTQDHLDFHGTMEAYFAAKRRLFTDLPHRSEKPFIAVINEADAHGRELLRHHVHRGIALAVEGAEQVETFRDRLSMHVQSVAVDHSIVRFTHNPKGTTTDWIRLPLGGSYHTMNAHAAVGAMLALGYGLPAVAAAISQARPVPGRFEPVRNSKGIGILVDYAHTPDAIEKLLDAVRPLTSGRILTVFGCGGDRDRTKRPLMARAASERSDLTIITSDNPRTEDPEAILREVEAGIVAGREVVTIVDRREAVAHAVRSAQPGDVVVIAGKGHENYQIVGRSKIHMDDRELAREALK